MKKNILLVSYSIAFVVSSFSLVANASGTATSTPNSIAPSVQTSTSTATSTTSSIPVADFCVGAKSSGASTCMALVVMSESDSQQ